MKKLILGSLLLLTAVTDTIAQNQLEIPDTLNGTTFNLNIYKKVIRAKIENILLF